jgi:hypothetical protein
VAMTHRRRSPCRVNCDCTLRILPVTWRPIPGSTTSPFRRLWGFQVRLFVLLCACVCLRVFMYVFVLCVCVCVSTCVHVRVWLCPCCAWVCSLYSRIYSRTPSCPQTRTHTHTPYHPLSHLVTPCHTDCGSIEVESLGHQSYSGMVIASRPSMYFRLGEAAGVTTAVDTSASQFYGYGPVSGMLCWLLAVGGRLLCVMLLLLATDACVCVCMCV